MNLLMKKKSKEQMTWMLNDDKAVNHAKDRTDWLAFWYWVFCKPLGFNCLDCFLLLKCLST